METNLHSPQRQLIELPIEHADLNSLIDHLSIQAPIDEWVFRRLKERGLVLRDPTVRLAAELEPPEPA